MMDLLSILIYVMNMVFVKMMEGVEEIEKILRMNVVQPQIVERIIILRIIVILVMFIEIFMIILVRMEIVKKIVLGSLLRVVSLGVMKILVFVNMNVMIIQIVGKINM